MNFCFYRKSGMLIVLLSLVLVPWRAVWAQAEAPAEVGVFEDYAVPPGTRVEVPIAIRGVEALYAVDIELQFDPALLAVEDANPNMDGVQPALGTFLDAGLTLFNDVDNDAGVLRFAMTQANPSEPKSGEGVLLVLYFQALAEGESSLTVNMVELSDRLGEAIPVTGVDATVTVSGGAQESVATAIPVQDPTGMVPVPTMAATEVPEEVPEVAAEAPVDAPAEDPAEGETAGSEVGEETTDEQAEANPEEIYVPMVESGSAEDVNEAQGKTLLDYWWVVLIAVVTVVGLAAYLVVSKK